MHWHLLWRHLWRHLLRLSKIQRQIGEEDGHLAGEVKRPGNVQLDGGNVLDGDDGAGVVDDGQVDRHLEGDAVRAVAFRANLRSGSLGQLVRHRSGVLHVALEGHLLLEGGWRKWKNWLDF